MPPTDHFVTCFAAEPPQEALPTGRWADTLRVEFLAACLRVEAEDGEDLGSPGDIAWHPDRTWDGRTYVPATTRTTTGYELYGYVSFVIPADGDPSDFRATADYTGDVAEANPDWRLDLCEDVIGTWRGERGKRAAMTLVWGRPLVNGGDIVTAELADLAVDQCFLVEERFTLIAPDDYRGDILDIKLFDANERELARESLYVDDEDE